MKERREKKRMKKRQKVFERGGEKEREERIYEKKLSHFPLPTHLPSI